MSALIDSGYLGVIQALGLSPTARKGSIKAERVERLDLSLEGVALDVHSGWSRASCVRVKALHPKGVQIRNERQLTLVSSEELTLIAERLGLDALDERWLGANICVKGIPDLSHLPPGARLQAPSGATLVVDLQNHPCSVVSRTINEAQPGHGSGFKAQAEGLRGVTLMVERAGALFVGDSLRLFVPTQRPWLG